MDGVICATSLALITVAAEIAMEKIIMQIWQKGSSSKRGLVILRQEIF